MDRTLKPAGQETRAAAPTRGVGSFAAGLLLAVVALMMVEQSARWMLTTLTRSRFVADQFQIDHYRNQPGRGGFGYGGHLVSSGEVLANGAALVASPERLRELEAAGRMPGARVPVHYLPPRQPWTAFDRVIAFRVQAPDVFDTNALGWTIVNVIFASAAILLMRRGVRLVKQSRSA